VRVVDVEPIQHEFTYSWRDWRGIPRHFSPRQLFLVVAFILTVPQKWSYNQRFLLQYSVLIFLPLALEAWGTQRVELWVSRSWFMRLLSLAWF